MGTGRRMPPITLHFFIAYFPLCFKGALLALGDGLLMGNKFRFSPQHLLFFFFLFLFLLDVLGRHGEVRKRKRSTESSLLTNWLDWLLLLEGGVEFFCSVYVIIVLLEFYLGAHLVVFRNLK